MVITMAVMKNLFQKKLFFERGYAETAVSNTEKDVPMPVYTIALK
jgi:hypothetical protein